MKRREVVKKVAITAGALAVPSAVMALGIEKGILGLSREHILAIYDPTLDPHAKPTLRGRDALDGFEPLLLAGLDYLPADSSCPNEVMKCGAVVDSKICQPFLSLVDQAETAAHTALPNPDFAHCFRVTLDGQMVAGAYAANRKDGWVMFKPVDDTGKYIRTADGDYVTGIAFGHVEFHVKKGLISCQILHDVGVVVDFPSMNRRPYPVT